MSALKTDRMSAAGGEALNFTRKQASTLRETFEAITSLSEAVYQLPNRTPTGA